MAGPQEKPAASPAITLVEMNGRIAELEAQRNEALTRCAKLAGEKAFAHEVLRQAQAEIDRLNALIAPAPAAGGEPASPALN